MIKKLSVKENWGDVTLLKVKDTNMKIQTRKRSFKLFTISSVILMFGWIDWRTGFELNFFLLYFIPVCLAAWLCDMMAAVLFSVLCTLVWFIADRLAGHVYSTINVMIWNTSIRFVSFAVIGFSFHKIRLLLKAERKSSSDMEKALSEIKVLESFLSVCCVCKKIRNENGNWQPMEFYIASHSDTKFSHAYCPECAEKAIKGAL